MNRNAMLGLALVLLVIGILVYVFVFYEKRDYPNNTARENIDFVSGNFDNNMSITQKIQDFDIFKYSGFDLKSPLSTYTNSKSSSNPYNKTAATNIDPNLSLNSTISPGDSNLSDNLISPSDSNLLDDTPVDFVDAVLPMNNMDSQDLTPSLSGLNANTEATIRESMVKSELRRIRR